MRLHSAPSAARSLLRMDGPILHPDAIAAARRPTRAPPRGLPGGAAASATAPPRPAPRRPPPSCGPGRAGDAPRRATGSPLPRGRAPWPARCRRGKKKARSVRPLPATRKLCVRARESRHTHPTPTPSRPKRLGRARPGRGLWRFPTVVCRGPSLKGRPPRPTARFGSGAGRPPALFPACPARPRWAFEGGTEPSGEPPSGKGPALEEGGKNPNPLVLTGLFSFKLPQSTHCCP